MTRRPSPDQSPGHEPASDPQPAPWHTLPEPPGRQLDDLGPQLLDGLYGGLLIDEEWSVRTERSFTWWPHRLAQHVTASEPRLAFGDPMIALHGQSDVVAEVTAPQERVTGLLADLNRNATLGAYVWDPAQRTIGYATSAYLYEGNLGVQEVLRLALLLGATEAELVAEALAAELEGKPAYSSHPTSGPRPVGDDLLNFVGQIVVPHGEEPSEFIGLVPEAGAALHWAMASGDDEGFTGELPYHGDRPAVSMGAGDAVAIAGPLQTALVRVLATQAHPTYGSGALMLMLLPDHFDEDTAPATADALNRAEATTLTGFPQFGAWCVAAHDPSTLAFATFLPSIIARPGLIGTMCFYLQLRAAWAREQLADAE